VLWLDGDDDDAFAYSSGDLVSQWNDKSGEGNHAVQATVSRQPERNATVNGRSALVFASDSIASPFAYTLNAATFYVVATAGAGASFGRLLTLNGASGNDYDNGRWIPLLRNGTNAEVCSYNGASIALVAVTYDGSLYLFRSRHSGSQVANSVNGGADVTAADALPYTTATLAIGDSLPSTSSFWAGNVCEVIGYNAGITGDDDTAMMNYLQTKWGTP